MEKCLFWATKKTMYFREIDMWHVICILHSNVCIRHFLRKIKTYFSTSNKLVMIKFQFCVTLCVIFSVPFEFFSFKNWFSHQAWRISKNIFQPWSIEHWMCFNSVMLSNIFSHFTELITQTNGNLMYRIQKLFLIIIFVSLFSVYLLSSHIFCCCTILVASYGGLKFEMCLYLFIPMCERLLIVSQIDFQSVWIFIKSFHVL